MRLLDPFTPSLTQSYGRTINHLPRPPPPSDQNRHSSGNGRVAAARETTARDSCTGKQGATDCVSRNSSRAWTPSIQRQEKEGSNQMKRGNEEDQVWHRPTKSINDYTTCLTYRVDRIGGHRPALFVLIHRWPLQTLPFACTTTLLSRRSFTLSRWINISWQSIVISTISFYTQIHKITRIFYIVSRNFVALHRFSTLFLFFIFIFFFFFSFFEVNAKEKPSFVAKETHVSIVDRTLSCQSYAPPSRLNSFFWRVNQFAERWRWRSAPRAPTRSIPE